MRLLHRSEAPLTAAEREGSVPSDPSRSRLTLKRTQQTNTIFSRARHREIELVMEGPFDERANEP